MYLVGFVTANGVLTGDVTVEGAVTFQRVVAPPGYVQAERLLLSEGVQVVKRGVIRLVVKVVLLRQGRRSGRA